MDVAVALHALGDLCGEDFDSHLMQQSMDASLRVRQALPLQGDRNHIDDAIKLHTLGMLSLNAGDLEEAKRYFEESLKVRRALHGDKDHLDVAIRLLALGQLSLKTGDCTDAEQYLDECASVLRPERGHRHRDVLQSQDR